MSEASSITSWKHVSICLGVVLQWLLLPQRTCVRNRRIPQSAWNESRPASRPDLRCHSWGIIFWSSMSGVAWKVSANFEHPTDHHCPLFSPWKSPRVCGKALAHSVQESRYSAFNTCRLCHGFPSALASAGQRWEGLWNQILCKTYRMGPPSYKLVCKPH